LKVNVGALAVLDGESCQLIGEPMILEWPIHTMAAFTVGEPPRPMVVAGGGRGKVLVLDVDAGELAVGDDGDDDDEEEDES
jgi:hypothetical protein